MRNQIARRDFLKAAPVAAGGLAFAAIAHGGTHVEAAQKPATASPTAKPLSKPADVRISGAAYQSITDYPIQPKRY